MLNPFLLASGAPTSFDSCKTHHHFHYQHFLILNTGHDNIARCLQASRRRYSFLGVAWSLPHVLSVSRGIRGIISQSVSRSNIFPHRSHLQPLACRTLASAEKLASLFSQTSPLALDVSSEKELDKTVAEHNVVISLVPFKHHVAVIHAAIKSRTHVETTSYISDTMRQLDGDVQRAGITVLNEVGVDPGVDHLYAIKTISDVHGRGGKVREFHSYCGGLPSPECADNPLGFKFSWSPRGALLSQRNAAHFLENGEVVKIPAEDLMAAARPYHVKDGYEFVAYPNRNSVPFRDFYRIPEAHTAVRGSLRYNGNPAFIQALANLGWLEQDKKEWLRDGMTWAEIHQVAIGAEGVDEE